MPQIKLIEADDSVAETLSITKWDTDTITEFLQTYLEAETNDTKSEEAEDEDTDKIKNNEL